MKVSLFEPVSMLIMRTYTVKLPLREKQKFMTFWLILFSFFCLSKSTWREVTSLTPLIMFMFQSLYILTFFYFLFVFITPWRFLPYRCLPVPCRLCGRFVVTVCCIAAKTTSRWVCAISVHVSTCNGNEFVPVCVQDATGIVCLNSKINMLWNTTVNVLIAVCV